jgi:hypothetical protein
MYQPSGPGSIPGMSCSESAITRGALWLNLAFFGLKVKFLSTIVM